MKSTIKEKCLKLYGSNGKCGTCEKLFQYFMTYMSTPEIEELFHWGEQNKNLQRIMSLIVGAYEELDRFNYLKKYDREHVTFTDEEFKDAQWKAMVASVFLETWLFYSGFYYPLYFYGQGKLMQAGEIINLILRDESIHGLYVGRLAQEVFQTFDADKQEELKGWLTYSITYTKKNLN